jgi:two-component system cell cycle response regulator
MNRRSNPARILVVDDDPDTVDILSRHLQREGFVAIEAFSGADCLQIARDSDVDVILLDLMMPGMDGFQVCQELKSEAKTAEIPIILVTARDDIEARAEGIRLGASEFLTKPFSRRQLVARINSQLNILEAARTTKAVLNRLGRDQN